MSWLRALFGRRPEPVERLDRLEERERKAASQVIVALKRADRILAEYRRAEPRHR